MGRIRLSIYYEKNIVQSILLTAFLSESEGRGYEALVDYSMTSNADVEFMSPRGLSVVANQNPDGTHSIVVNGQKDDPLLIRLSDGQIRNSVGPVREGLQQVHFREQADHAGGTWGTKRSGVKRVNLLGKNNEKTPAEFARDLELLARRGWDLWSLLLSSQERWWSQLQQPSSIQIGRVRGSTFTFPWAMVYDVPLQTDAALAPCKLLSNWEAVSDLVAQSSRVCPCGATHHKNTLCPFGFWGFKHILEQPPSVPDGWKLPKCITIDALPAMLVAGISLNLDPTETQQHLNTISEQLAQFKVDAHRQ